MGVKQVRKGWVRGGEVQGWKEGGEGAGGWRKWGLNFSAAALRHVRRIHRTVRALSSREECGPLNHRSIYQCYTQGSLLRKNAKKEYTTSKTNTQKIQILWQTKKHPETRFHWWLVDCLKLKEKNTKLIAQLTLVLVHVSLCQEAATWN